MLAFNRNITYSTRIMNMFTRVFIQLLLVAGLLAGGFFGFKYFSTLKKDVKRKPPAAAAAMVMTTTVRAADRHVIIRGQGTVRPLHEMFLTPQVGGEIVEVSPQFVNGGSFKKGDLLVRIDPTDWALKVELAEASVEEAESALLNAQAEREVATKEWRMHNQERIRLGEKPPLLMIKKPQEEAALATLEAEQASLKQAQLNLKRTELRAPFDGRVSGKNVDLGQYVVLGTKLAELYSTDAAEISIPLDTEDLKWINVPGITTSSLEGAEAEVIFELAGQFLRRPATVVRSEGRVDEETRLMNVVVRVERPYDSVPPLAAGLFATVDIQGAVLKNSVLAPRKAVHRMDDKDIVWVVRDDNTLEFRQVEVARVEGDAALLASGLEDGETIVVSQLQVVTDGMRVRPVAEKAGSRE